MTMPAGAGTTPYLNTALTHTKVEVKAFRTLVFYVQAVNPNAVDAWLLMYDALAADVTVGTTTPTRAYLIPGASTVTTNEGGITQDFNTPLQFNTALTIAATTTPTGSTDPAAAVVVNIEWLHG